MMKRFFSVLLALCLLFAALPAHAEDQGALYASGMQALAKGDYEKAYAIFAGLVGYEDASEKAYVLSIQTVARLTRVTNTSAVIDYSGYYGIVDFATNTVVPPQWEDYKVLTGSVIGVKQDSWGLASASGVMMYDYRWDNVYAMSNTAIITHNSNGYGLIRVTESTTPTGTIVVSGGWSDVAEGADGFFAVRKTIRQDGKTYYLYGLCSTAGEVLTEATYLTLGTLDQDTRTIKTPAFSCSRMPIETRAQLWGYIDKSGNEVIAPQYLWAGRFSATGFANVLQGDLTFRIIDPANAEVYFTDSTYWLTAMANAYTAAEQLMINGRYEESAAAFEELGPYRDASTRMHEAWYKRGLELYAAEEYDSAITAFEKAKNYTDAPDRIPQAWYAKAEKAVANKPGKQCCD